MLLSIWDRLEEVFTVETLMTLEKDLETWERGTDLDRVIQKAKKYRYDLIPVTENNSIVGVLYKDFQKPEPLTDRWLVSRDTSVPHLLNLFLENVKPGFFVFHQQRVIGMVTPADLNKLPARVYAYHLIGELEDGLAQIIQETFHHNEDEIINQLGDKRQPDVRTQFLEMVNEGTDINPVQLLNLSELINIIIKSQELRERLEFSSRKQAENAFSGLANLRNDTMHFVRPLVTKIPDDLHTLRNRLDRAEDLIKRLRKHYET